MAEKKGVGHAYNVDFLNVVFAASSLFLFLSVIWMVWDDFNRDWKNTQREFARLELDVTRASSQQANGARDAPKLRELGAARTAARKSEAANRAKIDEIKGKLADIDARLYRETQDYQFTKATYDSDRYIFEAQRAAGDSRAEGREKAITDLGARVNDLEPDRREDHRRAGGDQQRARNFHRRADRRFRSRSTRSTPITTGCGRRSVRWRRARSKTTSAMRRCSTSWRRRSR